MNTVNLLKNKCYNAWQDLSPTQKKAAVIGGSSLLAIGIGRIAISFFSQAEHSSPMQLDENAHLKQMRTISTFLKIIRPPPLERVPLHLEKQSQNKTETADAPPWHSKVIRDENAHLKERQTISTFLKIIRSIPLEIGTVHLEKQNENKPEATSLLSWHLVETKIQKHPLISSMVAGCFLITAWTGHTIRKLFSQLDFFEKEDLRKEFAQFGLPGADVGQIQGQGGNCLRFMITPPDAQLPTLLSENTEPELHAAQSRRTRTITVEPEIHTPQFEEVQAKMSDPVLTQEERINIFFDEYPLTEVPVGRRHVNTLRVHLRQIPPTELGSFFLLAPLLHARFTPETRINFIRHLNNLQLSQQTRNSLISYMIYYQAFNSLRTIGRMFLNEIHVPGIIDQHLPLFINHPVEDIEEIIGIMDDLLNQVPHDIRLEPRILRRIFTRLIQGPIETVRDFGRAIVEQHFETNQIWQLFNERFNLDLFPPEPVAEVQPLNPPIDGINVHAGNRDAQTTAAWRLLVEHQRGERLNINALVADFIHYLNTHPERERAMYALNNQERTGWGPLLLHQTDTTGNPIITRIQPFNVMGEVIIARLWHFCNSFNLHERELIADGMARALAQSYEQGLRVCNPGKVQRLLVAALQGWLDGVNIDQEVQRLTREEITGLFFQLEHRQQLTNRNELWREGIIFYQDSQGNMPMSLGEFLEDLKNYANLQEMHLDPIADALGEFLGPRQNLNHRADLLHEARMFLEERQELKGSDFIAEINYYADALRVPD